MILEAWPGLRREPKPGAEGSCSSEMVTRRRRTAPPARRSVTGKLRTVPVPAANPEPAGGPPRRRVRPTMIVPHAHGPEPDGD